MASVMAFDDIMQQDFSLSSIYIDSCFVLAYLDSDDPRGDKVSELLDKWRSEGISKLGVSNHVFGEVVHQLFIQEVLTPLEAYHLKQKNPKLKNNPNYKLDDMEDNIAFLYNIGKSNIMRFYDKRISVNISDLIKEAKLHGPQREKLDVFYQNALNRFNQTIYSFQNDFGITLEILNSNDEVQDLAKSSMRLFQLEPYDALHFAIARLNHYDFFATLDGDFVHNFYSNQISTIILMIA